MTGAEKVIEWCKKFYEINGIAPKPSEIVDQLNLAIEEEKSKSREFQNAYMFTGDDNFKALVFSDNISEGFDKIEQTKLFKDYNVQSSSLCAVVIK